MATKYVLLVETSEGDVVGVLFSSAEEARAWEDQHETDLLVQGCVPLVSRREALSSAR